jgi:hypothetical protein
VKTRIFGVIDDDQDDFGHSCSVGEDALLCAQVGTAGSSKVGDRVILTGQVGIGDTSRWGPSWKPANATRRYGFAPSVPTFSSPTRPGLTYLVDGIPVSTDYFKRQVSNTFHDSFVGMAQFFVNQEISVKSAPHPHQDKITNYGDLAGYINI